MPVFGDAIAAAQYANGLALGASSTPSSLVGSANTVSGTSSLVLQTTAAGSTVSLVSPGNVNVNPGASGVTGSRVVSIQGQTATLDGQVVNIGPNTNASAGAVIYAGSASTAQYTLQATTINETATNSVQISATSATGQVRLNAPNMILNAGTLTIPSPAVNFTGGTPPTGIFTTGMIMMFTGSTAPTGWAFCNGTNGTPDLRGRFVIACNPMGGSSNGSLYTTNAGATGGLQNVVADHYHQTWDTKWAEAGWPSYYNSINAGWPYRSQNYYGVYGTGANSDYDNQPVGTVERTGATTGVNGTVVGSTDTRPPFYAIAYIMKL